MKLFASGNEAVAMAAFDCGVNLGCGYPGTPSSEILDEFSEKEATNYSSIFYGKLKLLYKGNKKKINGCYGKMV